VKVLIRIQEIQAVRAVRERMKKTAILLIVLMLISIGILSGCTSTKLKECSVCSGSGKCNHCDGTGWAVDWNLECDNCGGTGICPICKGSGQIPESTGWP